VPDATLSGSGRLATRISGGVAPGWYLAPFQGAATGTDSYQRLQQQMKMLRREHPAEEAEVVLGARVAPPSQTEHSRREWKRRAPGDRWSL